MEPARFRRVPGTVLVNITKEVPQTKGETVLWRVDIVRTVTSRQLVKARCEVSSQRSFLTKVTLHATNARTADTLVDG
jgi:hypothetical protein